MTISQTPPVTSASTTAAAPRRNLSGPVGMAALPLAVLMLGLFFTLQSPVFLTLDNLISISVQIATLMTIAIPFAVLMMAGKVDLSIGSQLALFSVIAGLAFPYLGIAGTVLLVLGTGALTGLINGVLVGALKMSPIIVTLGGLTLFRGFAQWLSPNPLFGFPEAFTWIGYGRVLGLPVLTWIMLTVLILGLIFMRYATMSRHAIALGVNERAAFLVGIGVARTTIWLYVAVGLATALAALMTIARINSAPSGTLGIGMELSVLTAVLLGGVPFAGGRGSLLRVALGVVLLGMLANGLILMNARAEMGLMVTGVVLVLAAGLDVLRRRRA